MTAKDITAFCAADVDNTIVSLGEMPKFEKEQ